MTDAPRYLALGNGQLSGERSYFETCSRPAHPLGASGPRNGIGTRNGGLRPMLLTPLAQFLNTQAVPESTLRARRNTTGGEADPTRPSLGLHADAVSHLHARAGRRRQNQRRSRIHCGKMHMHRRRTLNTYRRAADNHDGLKDVNTEPSVRSGDPAGRLEKTARSCAGKSIPRHSGRVRVPDGRACCPSIFSVRVAAALRRAHVRHAVPRGTRDKGAAPRRRPGHQPRCNMR